MKRVPCHVFYAFSFLLLGMRFTVCKTAVSFCLRQYYVIVIPVRLPIKRENMVQNHMSVRLSCYLFLYHKAYRDQAHVIFPAVCALISDAAG